MSETMPSWVLDALDDNKRRRLILSWERVPGRGIVVVAADMEEVELRTERDAKLFLAGLSSALTAYTDGEAQARAEKAEAKLAAIGKRLSREDGSWIRIPAILAIIGSEEEGRDG